MLNINALSRASAATNEPTKGLVGLFSKAAGETASKANGLWESLKTNLANFAAWVRTTLSSAWATVRAFVQMKPAVALAGAAAIGAVIYAVASRFFGKEKTEEKKEEKKVEETVVTKTEAKEGEKTAEVASDKAPPVSPKVEANPVEKKQE